MTSTVEVGAVFGKKMAAVSLKLPAETAGKPIVRNLRNGRSSKILATKCGSRTMQRPDICCALKNSVPSPLRVSGRHMVLWSICLPLSANIASIPCKVKSQAHEMLLYLRDAEAQKISISRDCEVPMHPKAGQVQFQGISVLQ